MPEPSHGDALCRDLAALLGDDAVSVDAADRDAYAHDLWPRQLLATRGGAARPRGPRAVVWPRTDAHLAGLIALARREGLRLMPYGAGSGVVGAVQCDRATLAVDLKRMRALRRVDVREGHCEVDAGALGEHLEQQLRRRGATLGHFPSSIYCSTVGGWVVTRSAGQCSGRYGKIEDMVLGLDGVLADGSAFAVDGASPDAPDHRALLVGSEGLFGFVTRARLRVWAAPTAWEGAAFTFASMRDAWEVIRALYQHGLRPAVTRLYDPFDTYVFMQGASSKHAEATPAPAPHAFVSDAMRAVLHHAGGLNALLELATRTVYTRALLIVVFEGDGGDEMREAVVRARAICAHAGGRDEGEGPWRRWLLRRHAVSYRQPGMYERGAWVDTMEVAAPWSRLGALYDGVRSALSGGGFVMAHMSHAYPDGCSIYFTFVGASPSDHEALERYDATWREALRAAHRAGGTIAHHHGVGRAKAGAMGLEWGAGLRWIEALRGAADPDGVMVRGALLGATPASAPGFALPVEGALDATSRLLWCGTDTSLEHARARAAEGGFSLPLPEAPTVRASLARALAVDGRDPADHVVAGYAGHLPDGAAAWWLPCPRRAAGPDVLSLVLRDERFGAIDAVALRVVGDDERGPREHAPSVTLATGRSASLDAWTERAAARVGA
ncbi:MAG: FAD-binding oxidoreductase [Polyangiales bacterium]